MKTDHQQIEDLLNQALNLPPAERDGFLAKACGANQSLRDQVDTLLRAHADASGFLSETVVADSRPLSEGPGTRIGRYKLLQQIGEGGMGVVYMAEQEEPVRRQVALKIIKLGMDTRSVVARFEAERQALAMMDHPHIAKVLDAGATESGRPFFVMELVRGVPITEYCDKTHLPAHPRLELFITVCQAIQHAHQKGVIHRDIKPSNVLVTLNDGVPHPMVIDFGIAKATNQRLTEKTLFTNFASMIGTPAYMSPEQAEMSKLDVDTRSDIYSLGVLLYELLTGTTPFPTKELLSLGYGEMQRVIAESEPPRPSTRLSTMQNAQRTVVAKNLGQEAGALERLFKGDLDWIVMKCLEKDRTRRYDTANGLASDLRRHLENEPVVARPPSVSYRLQKAFRRNRLAFSAGVAILLALVLGLSFAAAGYRQAVVQRDRAEASRVAAERAKESEAAMRKEAQQAREQETALRQQAQEREQSALLQSYVSDMRQVDKAIGSSDLATARTLLENQRPKAPGDRDLRGWEWRYLWGQSRGDSIELFTTVTQEVSRLSFRADGRLLAISLGTDLEIWDWRNRSRVFQSTNARRAVFAKAGPLLALLRKDSSTTNETPALLNTETWQETPLPTVRGVAERGTFNFGVNDRSLIVQSAEGPDDRTDRAISLVALDVATGKELWKTTNVPAEGARFLRILSEDGRVMALTGPENQILLLGMENGRELSRFHVPDLSQQGTFGLSSDGSHVLTKGLTYQSSIRIWNARTGLPEGQIDGIPDIVTGLRFTPDGRYLIALGGRDSAIHVLNWQERRLIRSLQNSDLTMSAFALAPDSRTLATATGYPEGSEWRIRIWDINAPTRETGRRVISLASSSPPWVPRNPVFTADGRGILALDEDGMVKRWDVATLAVTRTWPLLPKNDTAVQVEVASDTSRALALQSEGDLRLLNLVTGSMETNTLGKERFTRAQFVNGGKRLLTVRKPAGEGRTQVNVPSVRTVEVWDLEKRTTVESFVYTNIARFNTPFGPTFLSKDGEAFAFDAVGGLGVKMLEGTHVPVRFLTMPEGPGATNSFHAFDLSPDRRWVAAAQWNGTISLWDLRTGKHSYLQAKGRSPIVILFFSPDGTRLMAGDLIAASLNIWDVGSRRQVGALSTKEFGFSGEASPDGRAIAIYGRAGILELWTAPTSDEIAREEGARQPADAR